MIDWLTLKLDASLLSPEVRNIFRQKQDMILRLSPEGEKIWEIPARTAIRSDSHQVVARMGSDLEILGSPARVMHSNNVFGSSNIIECFNAMREFICKELEIILPSKPEVWRLTRADITENYLLDSLTEVKQALNYLRHAEGGRYQIRTTAESVYWSPKSRLRSGKAYAKGPHLDYQLNKKQITITPEQLEIAQRILRLELSLKSQFWRDRSLKPWYDYKDSELRQIHNDYFSQFIGHVELAQNDDILDKLNSITTQGQAFAAYRTWKLIKSDGMESARSLMPKSSWYRHKKLLNKAGLSWADFNNANIVKLEKRTILLNNPIEKWK
ncbi:MAG: hypothetical protein HND53_11870 [Proteobacteria bacterium]|nr:hypothetical protein [Pseudomonadota bacterium]NOG61191.1 hypothetical protein [Pseudomonadota bacterium]